MSTNSNEQIRNEHSVLLSQEVYEITDAKNQRCEKLDLEEDGAITHKKVNLTLSSSLKMS